MNFKIKNLETGEHEDENRFALRGSGELMVDTGGFYLHCWELADPKKYKIEWDCPHHSITNGKCDTCPTTAKQIIEEN